MKKFLKLFDKYTVSVWAIVILLIVMVTIIPFAPGSLTFFGLRVPLTPVLVLLPILMGIIYAIIVSYEQPHMPENKKNIFRALKAITLLLFYVLAIVVISFAATKGMIKF